MVRATPLPVLHWRKNVLQHDMSFAPDGSGVAADPAADVPLHDTTPLSPANMLETRSGIAAADGVERAVPTVAAQRSALARASDPRTAADDLTRLAHHENEAVRAAVAANVSTPGPVLRALVRARKPSIRSGVAANPATPPDVLAWLAMQESAATLQPALAANPNTPVETLLSLAELHPAAFVANPALPLLLLGTQSLAARLSMVACHALLRVETTPTLLVHQIAQHYMRLAEASTSRNPPPQARVNGADELALLAQLHVAVAAASAASTAAAAAVVAAPATRQMQGPAVWGAADGSSIVPAVVPAPHDQQRHTIAAQLWATVAANDHRWLASSNYNFAHPLQHSDIPAGLLPAWLLRRMVAWGGQACKAALLCPDLPAGCLRDLAARPDPTLREAVATHRNCPPDVLRQLAQVADQLAALLAAERSGSVAPATVASSYVTYGFTVPVSPARPASRGTGGRQVDDLRDTRLAARQHRDALRVTLAQHPATPPDLLDHLARRRAWEIRQQVARHPNASLETLRLLLSDETPEVRSAAARHPRLPESSRELLRSDRAPIVRQAAETASRRAHLLSIAASGHVPSPEPFVSASTRSLSPGGPPDEPLPDRVPPVPAVLLPYGFEVASTEIWKAVAEHPAAPAVLLAWAACHPGAEPRKAAARHAATPGHILRALYWDAKDEVAEVAAGHPALPQSAREEKLTRCQLTDGQRLRALLGEASPLPPDLAGTDACNQRFLFCQQLLADVLHRWARARTVPEDMTPILLAAAAAPTLSPADAAMAAACSHWLVRFIAASNPATSAPALQDLARDGLVFIREAAAATLAAVSSAASAPGGVGQTQRTGMV